MYTLHLSISFTVLFLVYFSTYSCNVIHTVKYRIAAASELEPLPIYSRTNQVIPKEKFNNDRSRLTAATTLVCAAAVAGTCIPAHAHSLAACRTH